jgi:cytochrome oxidase Cu insertion factor (SCO1/SenC/PrrC family)
MLNVRTKNTITKRVKVEASKQVNHHLIQNLEHKDIIKTAAASQTETRREVAKKSIYMVIVFIYAHCVYICSLFLDSMGQLLMMPSSSQVLDHQLISQIIFGVGQFHHRPKRGEKTKTKTK